VEQVSGESVEVRQSAIGSVSGGTVSLRQALVRQVTAEQAVMSQSATALALAFGYVVGRALIRLLGHLRR
jgi:hypothetical protein